MTGIAKIKGINEFLENILVNHETQKLIIFCHHQDVMDGIENFLCKKLCGKFHIRIDGATFAIDRQRYVN